jgi:hypothetical protein
MNNKLSQLKERRAALVDKAARQREEMADAFEPLSGAFSGADKGIHALQYLAKHPVILAGMVALAVIVKPKRWFVLLESGWMAWRLALAAKRNFELKE